jgi:hypothetical protein
MLAYTSKKTGVQRCYGKCKRSNTHAVPVQDQPVSEEPRVVVVVEKKPQPVVPERVLVEDEPQDVVGGSNDDEERESVIESRQEDSLL